MHISKQINSNRCNVVSQGQKCPLREYYMMHRKLANLFNMAYIKTELPGVELAKMSIREHKRLKIATILHKNIKIAQTSQEETNRAHSY